MDSKPQVKNTFSGRSLPWWWDLSLQASSNVEPNHYLLPARPTRENRREEKVKQQEERS